MNKYWEKTGKYLSGEASAQEKEELKGWVNDSASNKNVFDDAEWLWEASGRLAPSPDVNTEEEWDKLLGLVKDQNQKTATVVPIKRTSYLVAAAISLFIISAVSFFIWNAGNDRFAQQALLESRPSIEKHKIIEVLSVITADSLQTITLADNTIISLNSHSNLAYNTRYGKTNRRIKLSGEAFFDVKRDSLLPFIVHAGPAEIRVLGTKFNVKEEGEEVVVDVEEGTVAVSSVEAPDEEEVINKDEQVALNKKNRKLIKFKSDINLRWWLKDKAKEVNKLFKKLKIK